MGREIRDRQPSLALRPSPCFSLPWPLSAYLSPLWWVTWTGGRTLSTWWKETHKRLRGGNISPSLPWWITNPLEGGCSSLALYTVISLLRGTVMTLGCSKGFYGPVGLFQGWGAPSRGSRFNKWWKFWKVLPSAWLLGNPWTKTSSPGLDFACTNLNNRFRAFIWFLCLWIIMISEGRGFGRFSSSPGLIVTYAWPWLRLRQQEHTFDRVFVSFLGISRGTVTTLVVVWPFFCALNVENTHENMIYIRFGFWKCWPEKYKRPIKNIPAAVVFLYLLILLLSYFDDLSDFKYYSYARSFHTEQDLG